MKPIRVILCDDHALVRAGFRSLLQNIPDMEVIAEADDGRKALQLIEQNQPDVLLIDIAMNGMNGLEVAMRVSQQWPAVRVIILSMYANAEYVVGALHAGASGYLLKDADGEELKQAIRIVMRGNPYFSPQISRLAVAQYEQRLAGRHPPEMLKSPFELLTPRQREVLQAIAEGHSTRKIAQSLHISAKTVEVHRAQLMERLNIYEVSGLVRYAIRHGLVTPDQ